MNNQNTKKLQGLFFAIIAMLVLSIIVIPSYATESDDWDGTVATGFAGGSGTEADPYIIRTAEQFAFFAQSVNSGTTYRGKYVKLAADMVLNDETFTFDPDTGLVEVTDGTNIAYLGTGINGDGHTVKGIYINNSSNYQGLFGYTKYATISNIGVIESYVRGRSNTGAISGFSKFYGECIIDSCYNAGIVLGDSYVGGVFG